MRHTRLITAAAAIALLTACGDGQGGNGYGTPAPAPETETAPENGMGMDEENTDTSATGIGEGRTGNPLNPVATEAEPAELDTIQGSWGFDAAECSDAAWVISENEFITGPTGMLCTYTPDTVTASLDDGDMSTSFAVPAECTLDGRQQPMVFSFTLSENEDTLYVSGSEGIDLTLKDCESIAPASDDGQDSEDSETDENGGNGR